MNETQVRQIFQEMFQQQTGQTQYQVSSIPSHVHNGIDSQKIPPTSVTNFIPLPANNTGDSTTAGVLSTNNIGVSTPPFNIIYPFPVIRGYGVGTFSGFNGGTAQFGSAVIFMNDTLYQLWIRLEQGDGTPIWAGVTLDLTA